MKIIMNYCESAMDAVISYKAVENAIEEGIKEGRHNFKCYIVQDKYIGVCKNKKSYTTCIKNK